MKHIYKKMLHIEKTLSVNKTKFASVIAYDTMHNNYHEKT